MRSWKRAAAWWLLALAPGQRAEPEILQPPPQLACSSRDVHRQPQPRRRVAQRHVDSLAPLARQSVCSLLPARVGVAAVGVEALGPQQRVVGEDLSDFALPSVDLDEVQRQPDACVRVADDVLLAYAASPPQLLVSPQDVSQLTAHGRPRHSPPVLSAVAVVLHRPDLAVVRRRHRQPVARRAESEEVAADVAALVSSPKHPHDVLSHRGHNPRARR
eukprot:764944-Hanusia_phi.AAC.7